VKKELVEYFGVKRLTTFGLDLSEGLEIKN
jgi:hypothetical protein